MPDHTNAGPSVLRTAHDVLFPTLEDRIINHACSLISDDEVTPKGSSPVGGHTTVIQRVLERRSEKRATTEEGTTATVAVMVRVLPPPKALLVFENARYFQEFERLIAPGVLDYEAFTNEAEALRRLEEEFRPVIVTDSLEFVRRVRSRRQARTPFVVYVSELDESEEREAGLVAGADECVGRRAGEREFAARIEVAKHVAELEAVLRITLEENRKLSATDDLTRVASRRFFAKHFPREVERAARYGRPLSLVLCDIDHFKTINDTSGHAGGDDILRQFAGRLQKLLRGKVDWVARIGGEEFAIVLPEIGYEGGFEVARKIRAFVAHAPFDAQGKLLKVTASFGVCGIDAVPPDDPKTPNRMLKAADAALYRSKNNGRDRVTATRGTTEQVLAE
ncbi:MAG: GGDEF domain-containing protein [Steroidobacteraceae bacterium]